MTNTNETLGRRIARLRLAHHMTQERLAGLMNVSPQAVSKWENDQSAPDIMLLVPLASAFDVSVDELLGNDRAQETATAPAAPQPIEAVHEPVGVEPEDAPPMKGDEAAMGEGTDAPGETRAATRLHVRVEKMGDVTGKVPVDVSIPLSGASALSGIVRNLPRVGINLPVGIDPDLLFAAVEGMETGTLVDVDDGHDHVIVSLE